MHLHSVSPLVAKHHTNWRMRAIASLDADPGQDLHYSSVISVGEKDISKLQAILIEAIEKARALVRDSPEEAGVCYSLDAFRLDGAGQVTGK